MVEKYIRKRAGNNPRTGESIYDEILNPTWIRNEASIDDLKFLLAMTTGDIYKLVLKTYQEKKQRNVSRN
jgi:hypothetical protein